MTQLETLALAGPGTELAWGGGAQGCLSLVGRPGQSPQNARVRPLHLRPWACPLGGRRPALWPGLWGGLPETWPCLVTATEGPDRIVQEALLDYSSRLLEQGPEMEAASCSGRPGGFPGGIGNWGVLEIGTQAVLTWGVKAGKLGVG